MREYEVMMILDAGLEEKDAKDAVDQFLNTLSTHGGKVTNVEHWGKRRFSYEIRHMTEGYYSVVRVEATPEQMDELSRVLGLADQVIRHKIVRPAPAPAST
jgi:small subunit ribosomal protein S6